MAQPAFVLNVEQFDRLCESSGFKTRSAFARAAGMPRRTLQLILSGEHGDLQLATIAPILDAFPLVDFRDLFTRVDTRSNARLRLAS